MILTYTFDFGDGTAMLITQNGNATHKFASGDTFEIVICAKDEDGGETCRTSNSSCCLRNSKRVDYQALVS